MEADWGSISDQEDFADLVDREMKDSVDGLARRPSMEYGYDKAKDGQGADQPARDGRGADQPTEDGFEDSLELEDCQEFDNVVKSHVENKRRIVVSELDQSVIGVGDQSELVVEQEQDSRGVDEEEDWLGSQLEQESFNDQTLTFCILNEMEDMQRVVTSPRVVQRMEDDIRNSKDDIWEKEDDVVDPGRQPPNLVVKMIPGEDDTSTSLVEAGEVGCKETILNLDGGLGTGDIPDNHPKPLDDNPSGGVPSEGTTMGSDNQPRTNSSCHGATFAGSPGMASSAMIAGMRYEEKRDTGMVEDDPPVTTPGLGMEDAVEPCEGGMIIAPSVGISGVSSGVMCGDDDTSGMRILRDDRMTDDVVRGARAKPVMVASSRVMDDDVLSKIDSLTAEPSVANTEYPGKVTSKNFTMYSNSVMLEARTEIGSASEPGVQEDDIPGQVGKKDAPTKEMVRSPGIHRKCVHSKKGVCSTHGPGAKERWRPGNKVVSVVDGVKKYETTKIYFWECDLGSKGRKLQQTGISRFLSPARGRREGNQTVGEATLLGAEGIHTVGQYGDAE